MNNTSPSVSAATLQAWNAAIAEAMTATESTAFPARLIDALSILAPVETVLMSLESRGQAPQLLYERGVPKAFSEPLTERYFTRGYLLDPFCLALDEGLAEGFYPLAEIAPDDFFSSEYYKTYYLKCGAPEDSHFIIDLDSEHKLSLCLFQAVSHSYFDAGHIASFKAALPLVLSLCRQFAEHGGLQRLMPEQKLPDSPPPGLNHHVQQAFREFGGSCLSERERQIAHLLLRGHSIKSSAQLLKISPETVRMHRKNLYAKLQINSQAELFALFIDRLSGNAPD